MSLVDLHVHSTASDGTLSPAAVVEQAAAAGLSAIALTDHDTVDGVGGRPFFHRSDSGGGAVRPLAWERDPHPGAVPGRGLTRPPAGTGLYAPEAGSPQR